MVAVLGHWEIGYMTPIMEANYWNLVLRDFEITEWYMTPISGIHHNEKQRVNLYERQTYNEVLNEVSGLTRVFVEPRTKVNPNSLDLVDFKHPENVIYVFGSAHLNPVVGNFREGDISLTIPTVQNKGVFWSNQCLSIILYDRFIKNGGKLNMK